MKVNYVTVQQVNGKLWATAHSEDSHQDFSSIFGAVKSLYVLHFFESLKKAADTARNWNACYEQNGTRTSRDGHNGYWMDITDWTDEDEYRYLLDLKNNQLCLYRKKAGNKAFTLEDTDSLDDPYTLEELQDHLY